MDPNGLIAVTEHVARAGSIVWWRLSGSVSLDHLKQVFDERGLSEEHLPNPAQPPTALARAMADHSSRRKLVRSLADKKGKALVTERAQGDDLDYSIEVRAKVNDHGQLSFDPPRHPLCDEIRAHYQEHLGLINADDAGSWLVRLVTKMGGVRLRDTGGVYFVPFDTVKKWEQVAAAIHAATAHRINGVPALRTEDAVSSILDALQEEASKAAEEMEQELAAGLTPRKALNRETEVLRMVRKVKRYESLLGHQMDEMRARLDRLRGNMAAAALAGAEDLS